MDKNMAYFLIFDDFNFSKAKNFKLFIFSVCNDVYFQHKSFYKEWSIKDLREFILENYYK